MRGSPAALERLTEQFARLPGVGMKSAQRLAFHVLEMPLEGAEAFAEAIVDARRSIHPCPVCQNLTDQETCPICADPERDHSVLCVVAEPKDVIAMERTREYDGVYHVLHGLISPMDGIGPSDLHINTLLERVANPSVKEVIFALRATIEGDTTGYYIFKKLPRQDEITISTLAKGIAIGNDLEYTDELTLGRSLVNRVKFSLNG